MSTTWFSADFHLGHQNIIRYCGRPFQTTGEMDAVILDRLNSSVKQNDVLYFLGDFCLGSADRVRHYRDRIRCRNIHVIEGNHDRVARRLTGVFLSWEKLAEIHVGQQRIVLCHYAMRVWHHRGRGVWHLYGHSHGKLPDDPASLSMDVGVDTHNFYPWQIGEIESIMTRKQATAVADPLLGNAYREN